MPYVIPRYLYDLPPHHTAHACSNGALVMTIKNEYIKILPHVDRTVIFYIKRILPPTSITLHHFGILNPAALMSLQRQKFTRPPCCHYGLWGIINYVHKGIIYICVYFVKMGRLGYKLKCRKNDTHLIHSRMVLLAY
jgi:hypothetical protein